MGLGGDWHNSSMHIVWNAIWWIPRTRKRENMEPWPTATMPHMPYIVLIMKIIDLLMAKAHKFSMF